MRKVEKKGPIGDWAKEWTEETIPLRVRKVPRMHSRKVARIRTMFQTFIIPLRSCMMTECRKAVPVNQGIREAFSTGSHPQ